MLLALDIGQVQCKKCSHSSTISLEFVHVSKSAPYLDWMTGPCISINLVPVPPTLSLSDDWLPALPFGHQNILLSMQFGTGTQRANDTPLKHEQTGHH
jgi:hypothetical protein